MRPGHLASTAPITRRSFQVTASFCYRQKVERLWHERGVLGVCHAAETECIEVFETALPRAARVDVTLPVTFLGFDRAAESYVLYVQPAGGT